MKKLFCLILAVCFFIVQAFSGIVFADSRDLKTVAAELNSLSDADKGIILKNLWDFAVAEASDGSPVGVDTIYNKIMDELTLIGKADLVADSSTPGDGKLASHSLRTIIQKLVNNKAVVTSYYNIYRDIITRDWIRPILGLDDGATEGEVLVAFLNQSVEVFTLNSRNEFVRYGDVAARLGNKFGVDSRLLELILEINLNQKVDEVAEKLNRNMDQYNISLEDAIFILELYNLYKEPTIDTGGPSGPSGPGGTGGGAPVDIIIDGANEIGDITTGEKVDQEAAEKIAEIIDTISGHIEGKTDQATASNAASVALVIKNAVEAAEKSADEGVKAQIIAKAAELIGKVAAAASNITDAQSSYDAAMALSEMIGNIGNTAAGPKDVTTVVATEVNNAVKAVDKLIDNITDNSKAVNIVNEVIESTGKVIGNTENAGKANIDIRKAVIETAGKVVERIGSVNLTAQVDDGVASAKIDSASLSAILAKAEDAANTATAFNNKLSENGIKGTVESKIKLDIEAEAEDVKVELPAALLSDVKSSGIDKVVFASGVASLTVEPDFVDVEDEASIIIQSRKVDTSTLEGLSEEQKQLIEAGTPVYDFNVILMDASGNETLISNFNKKVTVSIPYTLKRGEDPDNITVLYLADDGTVKNMSGKYDPDTGMVVFETIHFSKYIIKSIKVTFSDIKPNFWAASYIESMAAKGIISGRPTGIYDPQGNVTRAEFAKMVTVAMNLVDETLKSNFSDVPADAWYAPYVASAEKAGIITGYTDGTFRPDGLITREEMAAIIFRALGEDAPRRIYDFLTFDDNNNIATWARTAVAAAVRDGIITGKPGNMMDPKGKTTRAEAAAIIYRMFNY